MNAPFAPVDVHSDYTHVTALLTILADPAAHKARLDELIAQEKAAKEQIAALNDMAADTRRQHSAAQATTIVLNNRKAALDARVTALDERQKTIESSEAARSDASLQRREAAAHAQEMANKRESERLAALRTDLQAKHDRIKNLAGTLDH
jgi:chromosome segregation ATPase